MIIHEQGGRFSFEKEDDNGEIICTTEEIRNIKEMDIRSGGREYIKPRRICKPVQETRFSLFDTLECADVELLKLCRTLSCQKYQSEPVKPIHTAVRIMFHASIMLGRPYDVNMMASVLSINTAFVQQALKRWYKGLVSQSEIKEEHFIPTYLWIFGLPQKGKIRDSIVNAIEKYGDVYDGRSVFSIARDYAILYFRLFLQLPFSCVSTNPEVPSNFLQLVARFETRAKISRRKIFMRHGELNNDIALLFS